MFHGRRLHCRNSCNIGKACVSACYCANIRSIEWHKSRMTEMTSKDQGHNATTDSIGAIRRCFCHALSRANHFGYRFHNGILSGVRDFASPSLSRWLSTIEDPMTQIQFPADATSYIQQTWADRLTLARRWTFCYDTGIVWCDTIVHKHKS